jgi:5-methylcytosine-specific restriction endonuclease McrBC GTP-binding regulatory subunit McrB
VILTGLSGSGKTKLAQAFVQWICESKDQYRIIPVGADWTNREPLLGYPNGLHPEEYVLPDSGALQILIEANEPGNELKPYFIVLDEMNLSHVERYFADFLSVMESQKTIKLYDGPDRGIIKKNKEQEDKQVIKNEILWPKNLFILGTVNVDETTYMFSPKVLDRANVIEFRVEADEMKKFLEKVRKPELKYLHHEENEENPGQGSNMAADFVNLANSSKENKTAIDALNYFFPVLQKAGAEFGYRSAYEINRLVGMLESIAGTEPEWDGKKVTKDDFIDIAIMQKLLPKLHGSRNRLVPVLAALGRLCIGNIDEKYSAGKDKDGKLFISDFFEKEVQGDDIIYKLSFDKIKRMYSNVIANGFTSYAEA